MADATLLGPALGNLAAPRGRSGSLAAFTMVEIALSLAIIGFALVAIIGVLPAGLNVQKNNRQETIITQDANYFMDAIRNGARGSDDLTNNVISITNYWTIWHTNVPLGQVWQPEGTSGEDGYTPFASSRTSYLPLPNDFPLTNGFNILGLLSRQKIEPVRASDYALDYTSTDLVRSNHVVALIRAISGAASEKYPQNNALVRDMAFTYRLVPEVFMLPQAAINTNQAAAPDVLKAVEAQAFALKLQSRLHEVRLKFAWPVTIVTNTAVNLGKGRQAFRSLAGGRLDTFLTNRQPVYFFNPTAY